MEFIFGIIFIFIIIHYLNKLDKTMDKILNEDDKDK